MGKMKKILYIVDDKADLKCFLNYIQRRESADSLSFFICPITINDNFISRIKQSLLGFGEIELLPFVEEFNKNAFLYKDKFIKFLSDFSSGRQNGFMSLKKYFVYPFNKFSLWWLSLVQEKSTVKKESYHNLAKLITIINFLYAYSIDEVYLDIRNKQLKKSILRNKGNVEFVLRARSLNSSAIDLFVSLIKTVGYTAFFIIRKCIIYFIFGYDRLKRLSSIEKTKFLLITYFPFTETERKIFNGNIFKSKYYGSLQASIEKRYKDETSWIGILQYNSKLNINAIKGIKKINADGYRLFLPEELISFREIIISFHVFFQICLKFLKIIPYLSHKFEFDIERKINIWDIYKEEWVDSFSGSYLIGELFYYHIFSNIMTRLKDETVIMYPSELYAWENALNIARKGCKKIKTVGIQHSSISFLQLNYFNAPADLKNDDVINSFPLPDYLACSGEIPMRLLLDSGWPKERIFVLGAIRYHQLSKFLKEEIRWGMRPKNITVALSHIKFEVEELLLILKQAFQDKGICTFLIKPHISYPIDNILKLINSDYPDRKFELCIDEPLEDLLISSRAVITTSSTASLDGVACQCPVIIPKLSSRAVMNPLNELNEGFAIYVSNQEELINAVTSIVNSEKSPIKFEKIKSFINKYFTFVTAEDEYFSRLEKALLNKYCAK